MEFIHSLKKEVDAICGESVVEILHMVNLSDVYGAKLDWVQVGTSNDKYVKATKLFLHTTGDFKYDDRKVYHTLLGHEPETGLFSYAPLPKTISRVLPTIPPGQLTGIVPYGLYRESMEWKDGNMPTTGTSWRKWLRCLSREYAPSCYWTMWVGLKLQSRLPIGLFVLGKEKLDKSKQLVLAKLLYRKGVEYVVQIHEKELLRQSRAAAVSQVLARTLSHNLGSHSLNAFSGEASMLGHFKEIESRLEKQEPLPGRVKQVGPATETEKSEETPDQSRTRREWMATYNNYLRERMDLLADITTAVPAFEAKTHLVGDLLTGYANNVLLATTISGDEKFDYQWIPHLGDAKDLLVSIPADILGRHAFYIILENIVRNSAKHGRHGEHRVDYTVKVKRVETHPGYLKVTILDNHKDRTAEDAVERATEANVNINANVLGDDGRVRSKAWGMLEMKACAAYLRRIALEDLDETAFHARKRDAKSGELPQITEGDELPLLEAVVQGNQLGYTFYLQRPKDVMVVGSSREALFGTHSGSDLDKYGVGFMGTSALRDNSVIQHAMLVIDARDENVLEAFLERARKDMNALPHEILLIREVGKGAQFTQELAEKLNSFESGELLLDSIWFIDEAEWNTIVSSGPSALFTSLRQRWQVQWMRHHGNRVNNGTDAFESYCDAISKETEEGTLQVDATYIDHGNFYEHVLNKCQDISLCTEQPAQYGTIESIQNMDDITLLLSTFRGKNSLPIVQCYPSALLKVMQPKKGATAMSMEEWAQHHFTSWMKGVAVLDERLQRCAENDYFTPKNSDCNALPVVVKHLLAMGQVFVPPAGTLGLERDLSPAKWDELQKWLGSLRGTLRYVCIHLSVLEKLTRCVKMDHGGEASIEDLLGALRKANPCVRIIIVSGRGQPGNLPKGELFMSYSALSQYTTQPYQRAPVLLNMLCHGARRLT
jgi:hypothetical protein